ncbi:NADP-dependent oxidoreductase domain-containing protein [Roridomyces roridus]|uniref:NADP-dependent oxidoreductase domain-containing protein n=1 Tax=Roridomyces roridus TaxID=1738132 RepID=A0AAD7FTH9_9AGAR|nr:NADP-dependent oxidoreductase domain-containing protein [Roridomyces roridus]
MAELLKCAHAHFIAVSGEIFLEKANLRHYPVAAYQVEYSPFTLDIEDPEIGLLTTARELGVKIIAYSPLGRGLLTGQYTISAESSLGECHGAVLGKAAIHKSYNAENFPNILKIAAGLKEIGPKYNAAAGQVALAWLLAQGNDVVPVPGTKKMKYLEENLGAGDLTLSPDDIEAVRGIAKHADAARTLLGWRTCCLRIHLRGFLALFACWL